MITLKNGLLLILALLTILSGGSKIMLAPQEVEFFGAYGFNNTLLICFGIVQLVAGLLLFSAKTRVLGAGLTVVTFFISAIILFLAGSTTMCLVTLVFIGIASWIIKDALKSSN